MAGFLPIVAAASIDIDATLGIQMVVFLLFTIALHYIIVRPYMRAVELRQEGVQGSREEAAGLDARAEAAIEEYEAKLREARREASEIRETLRAQGEAEQKDLIAEAQEAVSATLAAGRVSTAADIEAATAELKKRAATLSEALVSKVLPQV